MAKVRNLTSLKEQLYTICLNLATSFKVSLPNFVCHPMANITYEIFHFHNLSNPFNIMIERLGSDHVSVWFSMGLPMFY